MPGDEAAVRAAQTALAAEGFPFAPGLNDAVTWAQYLERIELMGGGRPRNGHPIPTTFRAAVVADEMVGRASIRHELDAFHATHGGHIGYCVVPRHRRRGHATEILHQSLAIARRVGIERVLVTCDADNVGSAAVIERCGGEFESVVAGTNGGAPKRRYWFASATATRG
jgi:predicted acetyltransferase